PKQIEIALSQEMPPIPKNRFKGIAVVGMGGSALPIDVITCAFEECLRVPLGITRHYQLPRSIGNEHLVIASSFSGGTEETLSAIEQLPKNADNVVCVTAGGKLGSLARERNYPLVLLPIDKEPQGFQPRSAVGYFVTFFARVLAAAGAMADVSSQLQTVRPFLRGIDFSEEAESMARWLQDKIPVIYCDEAYHLAIARTAKIKFNENSKRPAFFNCFPEVNHNEMIGFTTGTLGKFGILYFHDRSSHPRIQQRFKVMQSVCENAGLKHLSFRQWVIPGETKIQKIFAALAFSERCSFNLALLDGFDPTPVDMVEKFKEALVA
ncbi:MAG: SIS domain-containing protein, partial [Methylococcales bacterium]